MDCDLGELDSKILTGKKLGDQAGMMYCCHLFDFYAFFDPAEIARINTTARKEAAKRLKKLQVDDEEKQEKEKSPEGTRNNSVDEKSPGRATRSESIAGLGGRDSTAGLADGGKGGASML